MESFNDNRPDNGQKIEVRFPDGKWYIVTYYANEGIDGIIEDEDGDITEIEEYEMLWRSILTDSN